MRRKRRELIGEKYGRLEVLAEDEKPGFVVCKCDCGNTKSIRVHNLINTRSCGCLHREMMVQRGRDTIKSNSAKHIQEMHKYGTNFGRIERTEPDKRNKTGHTGVWYNHKRGAYEAYINVNKKKRSLGHFHDIREAIQAREDAFERFYAPLIAARHADLQCATC